MEVPSSTLLLRLFPKHTSFQVPSTPLKQQSHINICLGHSLFVSQLGYFCIALWTKCDMGQLFGILFWIHFILEEFFLFFPGARRWVKIFMPDSMQENIRIVNLEVHLKLLFWMSRKVGSTLICKEALDELRLSATSFYCASFGCSWLPVST